MNSKVVILCGLPGSGKSTWAKKNYPFWEYINQDELGSRDACLSKMRQALQAGLFVVVDRTNINKKQRSYFIDLALGFGADSVDCVVLQVNEEECVGRIATRKNHATIKETMSLDKMKEIVYKFNRDFEMPSLDEGFNSILITRG